MGRCCESIYYNQTYFIWSHAASHIEIYLATCVPALHLARSDKVTWHWANAENGTYIMVSDAICKHKNIHFIYSYIHMSQVCLTKTLRLMYYFRYGATWQTSLIAFETPKYNTISVQRKMLSILAVITCLHICRTWWWPLRCIYELPPFLPFKCEPMKCLDYMNARPAFAWMCYISYGNSIRLCVDSHRTRVQCIKAEAIPYLHTSVYTYIIS